MSHTRPQVSAIWTFWTTLWAIAAMVMGLCGLIQTHYWFFVVGTLLVAGAILAPYFTRTLGLMVWICLIGYPCLFVMSALFDYRNSHKLGDGWGWIVFQIVTGYIAFTRVNEKFGSS